MQSKDMTEMTDNQKIAYLTKRVSSLEHTNKTERRINDQMMKAVLLKAVQGTYLTAVLNNQEKPVSLLSVADQYLEIK